MTSPVAAKENNLVGLKDLREHMETYIRRIGKGESLLVMRRNAPIFRILPVAGNSEEAGWETVVDFTRIRKGGVPIAQVQKTIRRLLAE